MKVTIVYWSGTGNTEAMAKYIAEGAQRAGAETAVLNVSNADESVLNADVLALGCPAMGAEILEEGEFEPFIESIESKVSGKKLALFGSYGWGDGEWMRNWTERMKKAGATLVTESLIVNEVPAGDECKAFGALLVKQ